METIGYIIYGIAVVLAVIWLWGVRSYTRQGRGVAMQTVNITLLFIVSLVVVSVSGLSPFHLLWMYPASVVVGLLSLAFPFSLLSVPGHLVFWFACIGLNNDEVQRNKQRLERAVYLVKHEGLTVKEAKQRIEQEERAAS
jgi:hypothetical protein